MEVGIKTVVELRLEVLDGLGMQVEWVLIRVVRIIKRRMASGTAVAAEP